MNRHIGLVHANRNNYTTALQYYFKATEIEPNFCEPEFLIGYAYWKLGQMEKAKTHLYRGLQCNDSRVDSFKILESLYELVPETGFWTEEYADMLTVKPIFTRAAARKYRDATYQYWKEENFEKALEMIENAEKRAEVDPSLCCSLNIHFWHGEILMRLRNVTAIEYLQKASECPESNEQQRAIEYLKLIEAHSNQG